MIRSHKSSRGKCGRGSGFRMMPNNKRQPLVRLVGVLVLAAAGLWAAGLAPLAAFGVDPGASAAGSMSQLKTVSIKAGRRITTLTIETSDPVPYITDRPDPLTLIVDLRQVDPTGAANAIREAKGVVAGVTVEPAVGADGAKLARVRIKLPQPAAPQ